MLPESERYTAFFCKNITQTKTCKVLSVEQKIHQRRVIEISLANELSFITKPSQVRGQRHHMSNNGRSTNNFNNV